LRKIFPAKKSTFEHFFKSKLNFVNINELDLYQYGSIFCLYFAAEPQRCVFMRQSRMYSRGTAATIPLLLYQDTSLFCGSAAKMCSYPAELHVQKQLRQRRMYRSSYGKAACTKAVAAKLHVQKHLRHSRNKKMQR
jgi:hypothetical protein